MHCSVKTPSFLALAPFAGHVSNGRQLKEKQDELLKTWSNSLRPEVVTEKQSLTVEVRGKAKSIIAFVIFVPVAIVADTGRAVLTATLVSRMGDGVLDRAIL